MNKWNKVNIRELLRTNFKACRRALIVLYQLQTQDEQQATRTKHDNDMGFNQPDARKCSVLARKAMGPTLFTPLEVVETRKLLWKYAGQLARIANAKARVTPPVVV